VEERGSPKGNAVGATRPGLRAGHGVRAKRARSRAPSGAKGQGRAVHRAPAAAPMSTACGRPIGRLSPGPRNWALLAVGLPGAPKDAFPDLDGVTAFRTRELRPGWVPSLPRGRRCAPGQVVSLTGACRFAAASPCTPPHFPSTRFSPHEASTRVHAIHPSGLPLACGRPDGTGRPWAFPRASHPADQEPTTHAEVGTGHRARTWNYTLNITLVDPPIGSSLTTRDLASHDDTQPSDVTLPRCCKSREGGCPTFCVGGSVG
jgi:hypothetical protein